MHVNNSTAMPGGRLQENQLAVIQALSPEHSGTRAGTGLGKQLLSKV